MTLNLTPSARVLIGCTDHDASTDSTDNTVTKVSQFNGQTENVSSDLASCHFYSKVDGTPEELVVLIGWILVFFHLPRLYKVESWMESTMTATRHPEVKVT